jgi:C1A family cysteine protease
MKSWSEKSSIVASLLCLLSGLGGVACSGETSVSDDEGQAVVQQKDTLHPLGVIKDEPATISANRLVAATPVGALPASVDLSSRIPPAGDQQSMGSCVGWAVGYAAKSFHEAVEEGWSVATTNHRFSPSWIYNQTNGGYDGGTYISTAMNLVASKGVDTISAFPYVDGDFTTQPDAVSMRRAARFPAKSWHTLAVSETEFKKVLAAGNVVVIAIEVLPDFDQLNSTTNTVYDSDTGNSRGRHALAVVGYDDNKRAFHFVNSWGTGFGDQGYAWLAYSFMSNAKLAMDAYVMVDAANLALVGDANDDGCVGDADYQILSAGYGYSVSSGRADARADFNKDGWVDGTDYMLMVQHWGEGC